MRLDSIVTKFIFWSVVLLILVGYAGINSSWNNQNSTKHDYIYWQSKYYELASDIATDPLIKASTRDTTVTVNQVTVLQFSFIETDGTAQQRVDRCESCHAGLENPLMTAENIIKQVDHVTVTPAQVPDYLLTHKSTRDLVYTLGAHPGKTKGFAKGGLDWAVATASVVDPSTASQQLEYTNIAAKHPFATYGCTTCHYGSGRELVQDKAHGQAEYWLQPLMPSKYMDAACAQCHETYNRPAIDAQAAFNTKTSKLTDDYTKAKAATKDPAQIAALDTAYKTQYSALSAAFQAQINELTASTDTLVPKVSLTSYRNSVPGLPVADSTRIFSASYLPEMTEITRGQQLFKENACWGCHKVDGFSKGNVGPELTEEGRIAVFSTIEHQLWDPRYKVANCVMPYFFSQKVTVDEETGKATWVDKLGKLHDAAELVPVDKADLQQETWDTLNERREVPGNKYYYFVPLEEKVADVTALSTYILAQTGLNYTQDPSGRLARLDAYNGADPPTVPVTADTGKLVFEQSGCYACHYRGNPDNDQIGLGGVAGPNLSWEGSRHSRQWVDAHYVDPQAFVPKSIMPVFPLSDSQRAALSLYDTSFVPKGGRPVSPNEDMPSTALATEKVTVPQVRYMTR
jgi:cbb3-type cytochrome oxidase cytochrome c subunit